MNSLAEVSNPMESSGGRGVEQPKERKQLWNKCDNQKACKKKLYEEKYVWFIIGWYPDNRYKVKDNRHI
ncbi:hypothetical protein RRG08_033146 [Elysia crispata]|uniref:Uncharacterized protein n=1 Tax=Elysia crispata TaxID=231223 RepID=A0AAE1CWW4_9GAST|nr:hypothetical protein RRG08_033146 [Elysia crispata]